MYVRIFMEAARQETLIIAAEHFQRVTQQNNSVQYHPSTINKQPQEINASENRKTTIGVRLFDILICTIYSTSKVGGEEEIERKTERERARARNRERRRE